MFMTTLIWAVKFMTTKTSKGGRPTVDSERVDVRMGRDLLTGLDTAASKQADTPARPEMVRRIVRDWLVERGHLPAATDRR